MNPTFLLRQMFDEAVSAARADNDSYGFFAREGGLVRTGPTGTNVNDVRAILVL